MLNSLQYTRIAEFTSIAMTCLLPRIITNSCIASWLMVCFHSFPRTRNVIDLIHEHGCLYVAASVEDWSGGLLHEAVTDWHLLLPLFLL